MNTIHISKKNIVHNWQVMQSLQPGAKMFPVLKSNAYGHGLEQMVKVFDKTDAEYLVVDSYPEYVVAKKYSRKPILLLGETLDENYRYFDLTRTTFCVYNSDTLEFLGRKKKRDVAIHIFLNTGMHREGVNEAQLPDFLKLLQTFPHIKVTGVMSHLHSADEVSYDHIETQIQHFKKMYYQIVDAGHSPQWRHISNTAGMFKIRDEFFNACRPGLGLYGYSPLKSDDPAFERARKLKPALSILSRIISLQTVWPGEGVSYNQTWKPGDKEIVATVPFGYAEGLSRAASHKIFFKCGKRYFQQVGTICMNLSCCQVDERVEIGEEIELVTKDVTSKNTLAALAAASDTIVYEALVRLDKGIRRVVV